MSGPRLRAMLGSLYAFSPTSADASSSEWGKSDMSSFDDGQRYILVADDDPLMIRSLRIILRNSGCRWSAFRTARRRCSRSAATSRCSPSRRHDGAHERPGLVPGDQVPTKPCATSRSSC